MKIPKDFIMTQAIILFSIVNVNTNIMCVIYIIWGGINSFEYQMSLSEIFPYPYIHLCSLSMPIEKLNWFYFPLVIFFPKINTYLNIINHRNNSTFVLLLRCAS